MVGERNLDRLDDLGPESKGGAETPQRLDASGAGTAEAEVRPFDDHAGLVFGDDAAQEGLGIEGEKIGSRVEADDFIGPGLDQESATPLEGGEASGRGLGPENGGRVRVEGQGYNAAVTDCVAGAGDEGAVPEVNAVEVADGDCRSPFAHGRQR